MLPIEKYLAERGAQCPRPVMLQSWRDLLFLHASVAPAVVQSLIPPELELDTFPDAIGQPQAWIGFVPFEMRNVRPTRLPSVPGLSHFPETNVRTYVSYRGRPGVYFFSLDAAQPLACSVARTLFALPYYWSRMSIARTPLGRGERKIEYGSQRRASARVQSTTRITLSESPFAGVEPGTLEFFLAERYLLFTTARSQVLRGAVFHEPYQLATVEDFTVVENLAEAAGLPSLTYSHAMYCPGVEVRIGPLERAGV